MLTRRLLPSSQAGFTLVELLVSIALIAIIGSTFLTFFKSTLFNYLNLQHDASAFTNLDTQAMRVANVIRSTTGIVSVADNDMVIYAYFYPSDTYVSKLHYYLQTTSGSVQLKADLTPMDANPPIGNPIIAQARTFTIIDEYYQPTGSSLFTYLNSAGAALPLPITDLQTIKAVRINLAAKTATNGNQTMNVQVSLRNRKTNL